jgi:hypothetical protein
VDDLRETVDLRFARSTAETVYPWLHNPLGYRMTRERTEARIAHFVSAGLDERRIRAWAVIRGAYLTDDSEEQAVLRSLLS